MIYRQGAKVAKERGEEALNLKHEIQNEEIEPRINADGTEIERAREARAEAQKCMSRRSRLFGMRKIRSRFIAHDLQSTICDHFGQRALWKNMKRSIPI